VKLASCGAGYEPHMKEFVEFYKDGSLKSKTITLYDTNGNEEKTITEGYRKDGTRSFRRVMNATDLLQYICYDKKGLMKFERNYYYFVDGKIDYIETLRPDREPQIWIPPSEVIYMRHY